MAKNNIRPVDLSGQVFDYLTVISREGKSKSGNYKWLCRCVCGKEKIVCSTHLGRKKGTKSCGCMSKALISQANGSHHMTGKPEYSSWQKMKRRCNNPKDRSYKNYGGRGISVCPEWSTFEKFLLDMGFMPKQGYTLERLLVNGNYEKDNCIWANRTTQARNRRVNVVVNFMGESATIAEWSERVGISRYTLYARIRNGWPPERAFTEPACSNSQKRSSTIVIDGVEKTKKEWADHYGVRYDTLIARLNRGSSIEKAMVPPA